MQSRSSWCICYCVVKIAPITASTPRWKLPPFRLAKAPSRPLRATHALDTQLPPYSSRIVLLVLLAASAPAPQATAPWKRYCTRGITQAGFTGTCRGAQVLVLVYIRLYWALWYTPPCRLSTEVPSVPYRNIHVFNNTASLSTSRDCGKGPVSRHPALLGREQCVACLDLHARVVNVATG